MRLKTVRVLGTEFSGLRLTKTGQELLHLDRWSGIIRALQEFHYPK